MMDAACEKGIRKIVLKTSSQVAKTEVINNIIAHRMIFQPGPMMAMHPTVEMARVWSQKRFAPMVRDTPDLKKLFDDVDTGDASRTITSKAFPGGHLSIVGANSPVMLSAQPMGFLSVDEQDRCPAEAGDEGDPTELAAKRLVAFLDSLIVLASTPTLKGESRIEAAYEESDQRKYFCPCPECGESFIFEWHRIEYELSAGDKRACEPESVRYSCAGCNAKIPHFKKAAMVQKGKWIATSTSKGIAGFWINEIYSPFVTWEEMINHYLTVKDNPIRYKTFVNTSLGETFEEVVDAVDPGMLRARAEEYPELPEGVGVITAGVDVHMRNLTVEVVGWGKDNESWSLAADVIFGDTLQPAVWDKLAEYLGRSFGNLKIRATAIDAAYRPDQVGLFVRKTPRVYAVRGAGGQDGGARRWDAPTISAKTSKMEKSGTALRIVGTNQVKLTIQGSFRVEEPGPSYCHFPEGRDEEWFTQMASEVIKKVINKNGFPQKQWDLKKNTHNHFLDCRVYAMAALAICGPDINTLIEVCARERRAPEPSSTPRGGGYLGLRGGGSWMS